MVLASHLENVEEYGLFQSEDNPWIKHLNTLWDTSYEQNEPPIIDKLIQINLGTKEHPKPIFINESLSPPEREDQIQLIPEYIEHAIYYLDRTMIGAESWYNPFEKVCLTLVFAIQKMWHHLMDNSRRFQGQLTRLLMTKPSALNGCLAKWAILLS